MSTRRTPLFVRTPGSTSACVERIRQVCEGPGVPALSVACLTRPHRPRTTASPDLAVVCLHRAGESRAGVCGRDAVRMGTFLEHLYARLAPFFFLKHDSGRPLVEAGPAVANPPIPP